MSKNNGIRIERAANGFIVFPDSGPFNNRDGGSAVVAWHVFSDLDALTEWLTKHFPET